MLGCCPTSFLHHLPEIINDIGQAVGIDDQSDGFAEDDNGHVAFEGHIGQTCQHTDEVCRADGPDHHEYEETIKTLAFVEPADILVVGLFTDHGLNELRPVHSRQVKDNGTANDNSNVVVDGPNDVAIDKDPSDRCQSTRDNRHHCLENLKKDKERGSKDTCLENKSRQGLLGLENASKVGPDTESKGCEGSNDGGPIDDFLEERRDLPQFFFFCYHNSSV